jgi:hypothetical protein
MKTTIEPAARAAGREVYALVDSMYAEMLSVLADSRVPPEFKAETVRAHDKARRRIYAAWETIRDARANWRELI